MSLPHAMASGNAKSLQRRTEKLQLHSAPIHLG
jgi:hypothetical protein